MIHHDETLKKIHDLLVRNGQSIGTAESCTGGLVGKLLTDAPGSSVYYMGGVISYSNDVKMNLLGVPRDILSTVGAVSRETAIAMAEGIKQLLQVDYSIATTGIAGPGGATQEKPVGLVYIGISGPNGTEVHKEIFTGNRHEVRCKTAEQSLIYLYEYIQHIGGQNG